MSAKTIASLCAVGTVALSAVSSARGDISLVGGGGSDFTVVIPAQAPRSLREAADELVAVVGLATGARLPVITDSSGVEGPFISLGATALAAEKGLDSGSMEPDTSRILTREGAIYILGADTADGEWTPDGGESCGTANGVYTFLEDYLGVRWLMPGEAGRDVPAAEALVLPEVDRVVTPMFVMRRLSHLHHFSTYGQRQESGKWARRMRLEGPARLYFDHNWWQTINRGFGGENSGSATTEAVRRAFEAHPDWFPMNAEGERTMPQSSLAKLETTNPELVRFFADQAMKSMRAAKRVKAYSLSPSDGTSGWSHSPEARALLEDEPAYAPKIKYYDSVASSLIAKWYRDISEIVGAEYPEGRLTGYIYETYINPPTKFDAVLPPNFTPMIAPDYNYGYGLYHSDTREYFAAIMDRWAEIVTGRWFYYDLPVIFLNHAGDEVGGFGGNFHGNSGTLTPAAPGLINIIFEQLVRSHINGALLYGSPSGINSALVNYVLARMMWDPGLDAREVQRDWLLRAYGPAAGPLMEEFYDVLDRAFEEFFNTEAAERFRFKYQFRREMVESLYAPIYPELEGLLGEAARREMSELQKQRLQLIEKSMTVLQWRLRNCGALEGYESPLRTDDAGISALIAESDENRDFTYFPGITISGRYKDSHPWKIPWKGVALGAGERGAGAAEPSLPADQILVYAAQAGDITMVTEAVEHGLYFSSYFLNQAKGGRVKSGVFNTAEPLVIPAAAGDAFVLTIPQRKGVELRLLVKDAAIAGGYLEDGGLSLESEEEARVLLFHKAGDAPMGLRAGADGVRVLQPFSGGAAVSYIGGKYSNVRVLRTLDNGWKFWRDPEEKGAELGVAEAGYGDSDWDTVSALDWWQAQGFADYHGVAWYRMRVPYAGVGANERALLVFGGVDGNTEVYLNGRLVAEHTLGPAFEGWDRPFHADVSERLEKGENTLAVRVKSKNNTSASGIFKGVSLLAGVPK